MCRIDYPILAYCPAGRGMLSDQISSVDDIPEKDFRGMLPHFQPPNSENNMELVKKLETLAEKKKCTPAQLALAQAVWPSTKKGMPTIISLAGDSTIGHATGNGKAGSSELDEDELMEIDQMLATFEVAGAKIPCGWHEVR